MGTSGSSALLGTWCASYPPLPRAVRIERSAQDGPVLVNLEGSVPPEVRVKKGVSSGESQTSRARREDNANRLFDCVPRAEGSPRAPLLRRAQSCRFRLEDFLQLVLLHQGGEGAPAVLPSRRLRHGLTLALCWAGRHEC